MQFTKGARRWRLQRAHMQPSTAYCAAMMSIPAPRLHRRFVRYPTSQCPARPLKASGSACLEHPWSTAHAQLAPPRGHSRMLRIRRDNRGRRRRLVGGLAGPSVVGNANGSALRGRSKFAAPAQRPPAVSGRGRSVQEQNTVSERPTLRC